MSGRRVHSSADVERIAGEILAPDRNARPGGEAATGKDGPDWRKIAPAPAAVVQVAKDGISAFDLLKLELPPPRFIVDGLLPEGLTLLAGKPKHGKSWLALMLGWAVAAGCEVDGRRVNQGEVLYLALEDTRRRLQSRIKKLHAELGWVVPETLTLQTHWPRADEGGLFAIADWLDRVRPNGRLVIVDTMAKFRKPQKGNGNGYLEDYEAYGGLKKMLDYYGTGGLGIHHTRKLRSEDPFDEISGTLGVSGAADTLWVLDTVAKGGEARLYTTGRDLADQTVPVTFGKDSGRWTIGDAREGIDTEGRAAAGAPNKVQLCAAWLKAFLREYAYPSAEILAAGTGAHHSPSAIRDAKASLGRKGTGEVWNKNYGGDSHPDWWSGLGPPERWKRRPAALAVPLNAGTIGESGGSGGNESGANPSYSPGTRESP